MNLDTTLDIANAFLSPGVYIRAELVPSHQPYARNGAVGSGINIWATYSNHTWKKKCLPILITDPLFVLNNDIRHLYLFIYLFIYLLCFANFTQSYICTNTNTRIYKLSITQWKGICYSFTPITAALTERT
jgi:hypothetical protein